MLGATVCYCSPRLPDISIKIITKKGSRKGIMKTAFTFINFNMIVITITSEAPIIPIHLIFLIRIAF